MIAHQQPLVGSARSATIRRLSASSYLVAMPERVRNVPQGSRILASLVLTVGNLCQRPTGFICR